MCEKLVSDFIFLQFHEYVWDIMCLGVMSNDDKLNVILKLKTCKHMHVTETDVSHVASCFGRKVN